MDKRFSSIYEKYRKYTMLPKDRYLSTLELVTSKKLPSGDIVECGVWKGGAIAGIGDVLGSSRRYHLFDSFLGLPPAENIDGERAKAFQEGTADPSNLNNCVVEPHYAEDAMEQSAATDYCIYKGWFEETIPDLDAPTGIAVLRLDADWYKSTSYCLNSLYGKVNEGGLILIDDYVDWIGCKLAVTHFLSELGNIKSIERHGRDVYYIKK